jgi:hypothetical protein
LTAIKGQPHKKASVLQIRGGPFKPRVSAANTISYYCGSCKEDLIVGQPEGVAFAAPVELLARCWNCKTYNVVPSEKP